MHFHFDQLKLLVKKTQLPTIAVVAANDAAVMQALKDASLHVSFKCVLIGDALVIKKLLVKYPLDAEVIHELDLIKMSSLAVELVRKQQADVIMKGLIDTKYLLKAVVDSTSGIKKATVLSHVALLQFPNKYSLIATDCAMNINPDLPTKWALIMNAVMVAKCLKVNQPKVGIVSAVEKVNPKIISTTDAIALKQQHQDSGDTSFLLDGPFAIDNLVSLDAVKHKGINSAVAGIADVLLFPELISANVFYKTSVFLANAIVAGIIVGATVPIILTSRADSALSKMYAILLAMVVSQCN